MRQIRRRIEKLERAEPFRTFQVVVNWDQEPPKGAVQVFMPLDGYDEPEPMPIEQTRS